MAKITPKFDFSSSEPAYTPTLIEHNTTPVPHNALKPAIFNEYERVMSTLANAIGDLVELTNVLPNSPQDIASIIRALMDKYADKVTTRSLEVTGSASIGAMRLEWKNNQQYYVGDIIVYEKKLYRCKEQHKAENMPFTYYISKWELIGGGGSTSIDVTIPAHGFRVGEVLCYYNTYIKAKANNRDTIGLFVVSKVADEDNFTIMQGGYFKLDDDTNLQGIIEGGASYFTPNTLYYLSPTINGGITATEPYISQPVIFAISETEGYVLCQRPQNVSIPLSDEFTYNPGQQSYNLSYQPATNSNLLVIIDNYILPSTSYSINNNTITLTDTYDDTTKIRVVYYATHAYNPAASLKEYKFTTNNPTGPGNYVLEEAPIAKQYLIVSLNGEILDSGDYELISNVFTLNIPSQDDVLRILVILESRVVAPDLLGISDNTIPGEKILQGSIMPSKLHPDILARLTTTWKDVLKPGVYDAITGEITSTTEATLSSGSMLISDANNVLHYYELSNSTTVTLQNNTCHIIAYITYDQFKIPILHIESKLTTDTLPANSIIICTVVFNNSTPTEIVYTYSNYGKQIDFNAPQGNQPFTVTSTTKVNNLNADLLDGKHSTDFVEKDIYPPGVFGEYASIPSAPTGAPTTGGTLSQATYYYRIQACYTDNIDEPSDLANNIIVRGPAGAISEGVIVSSPNNAVTVNVPVISSDLQVKCRLVYASYPNSQTLFKLISVVSGNSTSQNINDAVGRTTPTADDYTNNIILNAINTSIAAINEENSKPVFLITDSERIWKAY